jgi:hypothetical protein
MTYYQKSYSLPLKGLRPLIPRTTQTLTKIEKKSMYEIYKRDECYFMSRINILDLFTFKNVFVVR